MVSESRGFVVILFLSFVVLILFILGFLKTFLPKFLGSNSATAPSGSLAGLKSPSPSADAQFLPLSPVPPLFTGIKWTSEVTAKLVGVKTSPNGDVFTETLDGRRTESLVLAERGLEVYKQFVSYYIAELTKRGWRENRPGFASGAQGESYAYVRGNQFFNFGYKVDGQDLDRPETRLFVEHN